MLIIFFDNFFLLGKYTLEVIIIINLTQKETGLLKDLISQEQLCVEKYKKHSDAACDIELKNLLNRIMQNEQQHLDTVNQIMSGTVPFVSKGGTTPAKPTASSMSPECKQNDKYICSDLLTMEKHVSSLYDTCIFEFADVGVRDVLNHIQKEEQGHGEQLYSYMSVNGMY